jgi:SHS2 domain-containing protein
MWEHFRHEADIGVLGRGGSLEAAFEEAAIALTAVITDPASVNCRESIPIDCEAPDLELLLVDWLNAIVYEIATRRMLFCRFSVVLHGTHLHATACGEAIDIPRHRPAAEVKGATYTELAVCEDRSGEWRAQCVVDV